MNNREVARTWANQSKPKGRSSNGNFYFEGPVLYSYGPHYVAGLILNGFTFVNDDRYSATTGRHVSMARQAATDSHYIPKLTELHRALRRDPGAAVDHLANNWPGDRAAAAVLAAVGEPDKFDRAKARADRIARAEAAAQIRRQDERARRVDADPRQSRPVELFRLAKHCDSRGWTARAARLRKARQTILNERATA